jgi:protein-L-isoaspartate O-methyltransferase
MNSDNLQITCKICQQNYDNETNIPMVLICGHTLCDVCTKSILRNSNISNKFKCPFCNEIIQKKFKPKKNYEIITLILEKNNSEKIQNESKCNFHEEEKLILYCLDCKSLICQSCLINNHSGHKIGKAGDNQKNIKIKDKISKLEEFLKNDDFKNFEEDYKSLILIESNIFASLKYIFDKVTKDLRKKILMENFDYLSSTNNLLGIKRNFNWLTSNSYPNNEPEKQIQIDSIENDLNIQESKLWDELNNFNNKKQKTDDLIIKYQKLYDEICSFEESFQVDTEIIEKYEEFKDIKKESLEIYLATLDYTLLEYIPCESFNNSCIDESFEMLYEAEDHNLVSIIKSIDKRDFIKDEYQINNINRSLYSPDYSDNSKANSNHFIWVLKNVLKYFPKNRIVSKKILDIQSGTGFSTLILSKCFGPNSITCGLNNTEKETEKIIENIKKSHSYYFNSERIKLYSGEEIEGIPEEGPFDIIHCGFSYYEIPQTLIDQLDIDGILWIKLQSSIKSQEYTIAKKEADGRITKYLISNEDKYD